MKNIFDRLGVIPIAIIVTALFLFARGMGHHAPAVQQDFDDSHLPKSVMHYPDCPPGSDCGPPPTTPCYINDQYKHYLDGLGKPLALVATAAMDDGRQLQLFRAGDGTFTAMALGRDRSGQLEACRIAAGSGMRMNGAAPPVESAPAIAPVPSVTPPPAPALIPASGVPASALPAVPSPAPPPAAGSVPAPAR